MYNDIHRFFILIKLWSFNFFKDSITVNSEIINICVHLLLQLFKNGQKCQLNHCDSKKKLHTDVCFIYQNVCSYYCDTHSIALLA